MAESNTVVNNENLQTPIKNWGAHMEELAENSGSQPQQQTQALNMEINYTTTGESKFRFAGDPVGT